MDEIVTKFNMQSAALIVTPADPAVHLSKNMGPANDEERKIMETRPYSSGVGSVLYTRLTRADAIAAIAEVARFMQDPGPAHWKALKRIIRYLKSTRTWGLCYKSSWITKGTPWTLTLYVDSGFAMDPDKRRSRYGYLILLNANPVAFGTGLTAKTLPCTPVAEYVALAHGLKELLWTYQMLCKMGINIKLPMRILEDNQATICIADNPISQRRTRYVDIRYHFVRDFINDGTVTVEYCPTSQMLADILTKSMHKPIFEGLRDKIIGNVIEFLDKDLLVSASYCRCMYNSLVK